MTKKIKLSFYYNQILCTELTHLQLTHFGHLGFSIPEGMEWGWKNRWHNRKEGIIYNNYNYLYILYIR